MSTDAVVFLKCARDQLQVRFTFVAHEEEPSFGKLGTVLSAGETISSSCSPTSGLGSR